MAAAGGARAGGARWSSPVASTAQRSCATVEPQELLLDFLRDSLGLTGAKRSCDVQVCGACTVLVDGLPVSSCCYLAVDAQRTRGDDDRRVSPSGRSSSGSRRPSPATPALQCGFCTPGMLLTVTALLEHGELGEDEEEIKRDLAGNLCRCTGLQGDPRGRRRARGAHDRGRFRETPIADRPLAPARDAREKLRGAGAVRRRHGRSADAARQGAAEPDRARAHRLDRHLGRRAHARASSASSPAPTSTTSTPTTGTRSRTGRSSRSTRCASTASRWRQSPPRPRPRPRRPSS